LVWEGVDVDVLSPNIVISALWKKKKKQIGINHTQEGIGHGRQHAGRLRANNRRGGGGGKARSTRARERSLGITITQNQSSTV
jgi:hypothetical protein